MITPRITRLVRVPDLQSMHAFVACSAGTADARSRAVIVPTRGAAEALRRTIEDLRVTTPGSAIVLPDLVTRAEFYQRLHASVPGLPPHLTEFDREVIFRKAAHDVEAHGAPAPFRLRAGLIVEVLAFYDELRRRGRTVQAFARNMLESLEPNADSDRGAERLLRLTTFLAAAFEMFELRVQATGCVDEHGVRARLLAGEDGDRPPYTHVIVTVPDQAADSRGLWLADYDLLARLPNLERTDVVATENVLATAYHQRLHDVFPGIQEERFGSPAPLPVLAVPAPPDGTESSKWFVCRDREEELAEVARAVKRRAGAGLDRTAVFFQRPLPYLYLARQVFPDSEVPYQTHDALPLAAEPFAAALDLVFSFLVAQGTRAATVSLMRSPHFGFTVEGHVVTGADVAAMDAALRDAKYVGGWDRLAAIASARSLPALRAAADVAHELRGVSEAPAASGQIAALVTFIAAHERLPEPGDPWSAGHLRARAAVLAALQSLEDAHRAHDERPVPLADLVNAVRRWIEAQTFSPRTGGEGLWLLDAASAAYASVDEVRLVGLVDSDWPDRGRRNIFYPSSLLTQLGWPSDAERLDAARAGFRDLLALAGHRVSLSTFTLEDDAIVPASSFLEEVEHLGFPVEQVAAPPRARVFLHEALTEEPLAAGALSGPAREWIALRASRSDHALDAFHGAAGVREAGVYSVSSLERYLQCPFKYFATHVLRVPEEREDESGLSPLERGHFLHDVFERFFDEWQRTGHGTITTGNVAEAVAVFEGIAEARLATLPESDRALETTYLLGSAAAPGLAERAFAFEIEQGGEVIERLLEHELEGEFAFTTPNGERKARLRAKADRIDLMADGSLRIVDYKLGRAPKPGRALQLPVYGVCAEQSLAGRHGRTWTLSRAGYVAFKERNAFVSLGRAGSLDPATLREAVAAGQERMFAAIDGIERGEFPPRPDEPYFCTYCGYAPVCRKDYVGDE